MTVQGNLAFDHHASHSQAPLRPGSGGIIETKFSHPHDTAISSALRFLSELIAWIAGPWAAANYSNWLVLPVLILLVGLPSVFSTTNDKKTVVVPIPGPIRVVLEFFLFSVAAVAPWYVWSPTISAVTAGIVVATILAGAPRIGWLLRGAPIQNKGY